MAIKKNDPNLLGPLAERLNHVKAKQAISPGEGMGVVYFERSTFSRLTIEIFHFLAFLRLNCQTPLRLIGLFKKLKTRLRCTKKVM